MSDFDAVLERLLTDPGFQARLAADPVGSLAGYRLSADEVELLRAQVTGDAGGHSRVEQRTSKASLFGLLSPLAGIGSSIGDLAPGSGGGASGLGGVTPREALPEPGGQGLGEVAYQGLAAAPESVEEMPGSGLIGRQLDGVLDDAFPRAAEPQSGLESAAEVPVEHYRTRVDANGDGRWDEHMYVNRSDGGVDIVVDANHDGRVDFVGHDLDRDGLIDRATTDTDGDGMLDSQFVDVNGDGWLDKKVAVDPTQPGPGGPGQQEHIGRHRGQESGLGAAE